MRPEFIWHCRKCISREQLMPHRCDLCICRCSIFKCGTWWSAVHCTIIYPKMWVSALHHGLWPFFTTDPPFTKLIFHLEVSWYSLEQYIGCIIRQAFNYCCSLLQVQSDLKKTTAVVESLSNNTTNVLFQRIPAYFKI